MRDLSFNRTNRLLASHGDKVDWQEFSQDCSRLLRTPSLGAEHELTPPLSVVNAGLVEDLAMASVTSLGNA